MKKTTSRAVESFLIVTFPIALFAGCAVDGKKPETKDMAMQDAPAYTVTEDDMGDAPSFTKKAHLLIDIPAEQRDDRSADNSASNNTGIASNDSNISTEIPTVDQLSEEAMMVTWINDTVDMPADGPVAGIVEKQTDYLLEVNISQMEADAMVSIKKPDLDSINFAVNTTEFDEAYLAALQTHAEFLVNNPALTLTVSGHTDSSGSVEYNKVLSERRALNVYYVLLSYGAPEAQLIMDAYGESSPLNHESNLQENRRVELEYSDSLVLSSR